MSLKYFAFSEKYLMICDEMHRNAKFDTNCDTCAYQRYPADQQYQIEQQQQIFYYLPTCA